MEEDLVREHLNKLNTHKPIRHDGMYTRTLRRLADVILRSLDVFERSWQLGKVSAD